MNISDNYNEVLIFTIFSNNNDFIIMFKLKPNVRFSQRVYNYSFYSVYNPVSTIMISKKKLVYFFYPFCKVHYFLSLIYIRH